MGEPGTTDGSSHDPEPRAGSLLSQDGRRADLFNMRHYPVNGCCRTCGEPIKAESFLRPFAHAVAPLAAVYQMPARGAVA
jgi:hypothetical protein